MNKINEHRSFSHTANTNLKECWWMQAGVVDYKLCDRDYDCEHCPFDEVLNGRATTPVHDSPFFSAAGPIERGRAERLRKNTKRATVVQGCEVADELFYHPAHTWVRVEDGGCIRMGLDDFALRILGRPYLITLPETGASVRFGEVCWHFTHQAGVSALVAPVSGRVKEINSTLAQQPALLNRDPYGEGWVLLIEPTDLKDCLKQLFYGPKVTQWYRRDFEKLYEKVSELSNRSGLAGPTMNDGGCLNNDFMNALTVGQLRQVIHSFFPLSLIEPAEPKKAILVKHRR